MRAKHVSVYDKNKTTMSAEMKSLFNEQTAVKARPPTPDLYDNSVPCIDGVKHLIAHCMDYETELEAQSQDVVGIMVSNPTNGLELVSRSLEKIAAQNGVPEYNIMLNKEFNNRKKREFDDVMDEENALFAGRKKPLSYTEKGPRSKVILEAGRSKSKGKTRLSLHSSHSVSDGSDYDNDDISLGSASLGSYTDNSIISSSVNWKNGAAYHSLLSVASPRVHLSNTAPTQIGRRVRMSSGAFDDASQSLTLDDSLSIGESTLASSSVVRGGGSITGGSTISSASYLKVSLAQLALKQSRTSAASIKNNAMVSLCSKANDIA